MPALTYVCTSELAAMAAVPPGNLTACANESGTTTPPIVGVSGGRMGHATQVAELAGVLAADETG